MKVFIQGQKEKIANLCPNLQLEVRIQMETTQKDDIDISCFGVDQNDKLSDEQYFIFYNQLSSPEGGIIKRADGDVFTLNLNSIPDKIEKLVFTAAIDGFAAMNQLKSCGMGFFDNGEEVARYNFDGKDFAQEKALILSEIYRKDNQWRVAIVGRGFNGGLSALLAHFGGEEEESTAVSSDIPKLAQRPAKVVIAKSEQAQTLVSQKVPRLLDLTKKAAVSLQKKQLDTLTAKVLLVLDSSGSMTNQYKTGRVQRILDKTLPLALLFDDDKNLESWAFGNDCVMLQDATVDNIDNYIVNIDGGWKKWSVGMRGNNEPNVMDRIIRRHKNSDLPVYILFISDGGVSRAREIQNLLIECSKYPIFWQFVGVGGSNYGVLERLDHMSGRFIDNANFFSLHDIDEISDEQLYERLMGEFPLWLKEARTKGILK